MVFIIKKQEYFAVIHLAQVSTVKSETELQIKEAIKSHKKHLR